MAGIVKDITAKRRIREELQAQMEVEKEKYQKMQTRLDRVASCAISSSHRQRPIPLLAPVTTVTAPVGFHRMVVTRRKLGH